MAAREHRREDAIELAALIGEAVGLQLRAPVDGPITRDELRTALRGL